MSRLMKDRSPGTYVVNPDTPSSIEGPAKRPVLICVGAVRRSRAAVVKLRSSRGALHGLRSARRVRGRPAGDHDDVVGLGAVGFEEPRERAGSHSGAGLGGVAVVVVRVGVDVKLRRE